MEVHKGWIRYTEDPKELLTLEDYYSQYIPRKIEQEDHNYADQGEVMAQLLPPVVEDTIEKAKKHIDGDIFVEVIIKADRRFPDLYKNIVCARPTCPSPEYERIAYHYHRNSGEKELLWIIPTLSRCLQYKRQCHLDIMSDDRLIADFVLEYENGNLDKLENKINSSLKSPKKNLFISK